MDEKLNKLLEDLTSAEKDRLYRLLWENYVAEDVASYSNEELTQDEVDHIVYRYVYEGDYDCNLSYWDNIDNLIQEEKRGY